MARILVIDDDDSLRILIRLFLEQAGHEVVDAANGRIALDMQRENPAELIITDIFMPEKGGTEFIMDMCVEFPASKIIAISGGGSLTDVNFLDLAKNLGALKTFNKPFTRQELLAAVAELLS